MCNIAGYAGTKQAAPILIEMIRKQEPLKGGNYICIITMQQGKTYRAESEAGPDVLCTAVEAGELPGTVGVIYSSDSQTEIPLNLTETEVIAWTRVNASLYVANTLHGTFVASAPLAFPEETQEPYLLPAWSAGYVNKDGFTCKTMGKKTTSIAPVTPTIKAKAYLLVKKALQEGCKEVVELEKLVKPLFADADLDQAEAVVYGVLSDIDKEGK